MSETFERAQGRRVIAADTAQEVGEVKGFVVDPRGSAIEAIHVSGRRRRAETVAWADISSFGSDAVMVRTVDAVTRVEGDHEKEAIKGHVVLRGARVLSTAGFDLGTVVDALFDPATGTLGAVIVQSKPSGARSTETASIDAGRFRALGSYALVVTAQD